jgi:hypothetical protein
MTRFGQDAQRGSQKWLQTAINQKPSVIDSAIRQQFSLLDEEEQITWLSPLKSKGFVEYHDKEFLDCLQIQLAKRPLYTFWPRNGPKWDGLGKTSKGKLLLVEAKSHIPEICSPSTQASEKTLPKIRASLDETRKGLGLRKKLDWSGIFYQYANRIAHLYLLRELNNLPAYLMFLYFLNDKEMYGPTSKEEWQGAIKLLETYLGLPPKHKLSDYILHIYLDISLLR